MQGQKKYEFVLEQKGQDPVVYKDYAKLHADFAAGKIHPGDMKPSVIKVLNQVCKAGRWRWNGYCAVQTSTRLDP